MNATSFKLTALALAGILAMDMASAQTAPAAAPKAPEPDYTISYNIGATSDYRYRGISQSGLKPGVQGGVDYAHKNGFYLGAWASTIKWIKDAGTIAGVDSGASALELDLYGGYKTEIAKDTTADIGLLQYVYPANKYQNIGVNANTTEIYGALTYGIYTAKYSHAITTLFGNPRSKDSGYLDFSATVDLGKGYSLVPHIGHQSVKGTDAANASNSIYAYTDWALTLNKDIDGLIVSAAYVDSKTKKGAPYAYQTPIDNKNLGKGALVVSIKKNF